MTNIEKRGIVSVHNKAGLIVAMRELVVRRCQLFATKGTADRYYEETGERVGLLPELVGEPISNDSVARERTARRIKDAMVDDAKFVQLAILNLRPPKLIQDSIGSRVSPDIGGTDMIITAADSGVLVITSPVRYDDVIEQIERPGGVEPRFRQQLAKEAYGHIADHFETSSNM